MRIAIVSGPDPRDRFSWSGTTKRMCDALRNSGATLYFPLVSKVFGFRIFGKTFSLKDPVVALKFYRDMILEECSKMDGTLFICTSEFLSVCSKADMPKNSIYLTDIPFCLSEGYSSFDRISQRERVHRDWQEKMAASLADWVTVPSKFAASGFVEKYSCAQEKVVCIPYATNMRLRRRGSWNKRQCRILLISGDWMRKGGDVALRTVAILCRDYGIPARLDLVGIPPVGVSSPFMVTHGFCDMKKPLGFFRFKAVFERSFVLLHPARADAFPISVLESLRGGLPVVSRAVGGIPEQVSSGGGILLGRDASAEDFAREIAKLWHDPNLYEEKSLFLRKSKGYGWDQWAKSIISLFESGRNAFS